MMSYAQSSPKSTQPTQTAAAVLASLVLAKRNRERADGARRLLARRHLLDFARYVDSSWRPAQHLSLIAQALEQIARRDLRRLMVFAPPRHGKSRIVSELFPAWLLGRDPSEQVMLCSHSQSLSDTFSRNVRNLIVTETYRALFPRTRLSDDSATVQKWTLAGQIRPAMLSVGVGGAPTGQGARVLIIDDPVGDAEAAESALQRDNLYRWYTDTVYPRLEPNAAIILMMQRWHEDDLAGRLLRDQARADEWHVLVLPALAETQEERDQTYTRIYGLPAGRPDPLGRAPDEALWPSRFGAQALREIERVNPRSFAAKYQQRPQPAEGALFKRGWLRIVDAEIVPQDLRWARYYDLAYSLRESASNTATIAGAFDERTGTLYLRRGVAGRYETPDVRALIYRLITTEPDERHGIEAKMHGGPVVQDLLRAREIAAIGVTAVDVHGDKYVRAVPVADRAAAGKVAFVRESPSDDAWIAEWIGEMCAFPYGQRDDRVDAVSGVAQMLANMPSVDAQPIPGRRVWEFVGLG